MALCGTILLGFTALAVDSGLLYVHRRELQNAADAAALAGAYENVNNPGGVIATVHSYVTRNGARTSEIADARLITTFNANDSVEVVMNRDVNLLFAPVLNRTSSTVAARAVAVVTNIEPYEIWPWGVVQGSYNPNNPTPQALKVGARQEQVGNFMALSFPGYPGSNDYQRFIETGYNDRVPVQIPPGTWTVTTQTGNMAGPTRDGVTNVLNQNPPQCGLWPAHISCPRYGLVPILSAGTWEQVRGHDEVTIVGFGVFYLLGVDVVGQGLGQAQVTGRWVQDLVVGVHPATRLGQPLEGLVGIRLWR